MNHIINHAESPFVQVRDLAVRFVNRDMNVPVVSGVSFDIERGEVLCLLGESGSGKSVTMRALMRLLPDSAQISGSIRVGGVDVMAVPEHRLHEVRGSTISMVFQEPLTALDPVFTIGRQIAEAVQVNEGCSRADAARRALELLELVQIPSARRRMEAYPHELSGGLRQRAMIAMALSCRPQLLLADEPTTALDATVQIQILLLLRELQKELGMATVFVTHDLGVAAEVADQVAVMYAGRFVETGSIDSVFFEPRHPYTQGLMRSTVHGGARGAELVPITGSPPDLVQLPPGCSFAPRCPQFRDTCDSAMPGLLEQGGLHAARCFFPQAASPMSRAASSL